MARWLGGGITVGARRGGGGKAAPRRGEAGAGRALTAGDSWAASDLTGEPAGERFDSLRCELALERALRREPSPSSSACVRVPRGCQHRGRVAVAGRPNSSRQEQSSVWEPRRRAKRAARGNSWDEAPRAPERRSGRTAPAPCGLRAPVKANGVRDLRSMRPRNLITQNDAHQVVLVLLLLALALGGRDCVLRPSARGRTAAGGAAAVLLSHLNGNLGAV